MENNFSEKIVDWYRDFGRLDFPWRKTTNPYEILIAEMMLQKTHAVEQVLPVYKLFLKKYPNIESLSEAKESEIRKIISSLGLQNVRSRRFTKLGLRLKNDFNSTVPNNHTELVSLPGVGDYIANAVLCMAFRNRTVMVDANFGRVLGRIFFGKEDYPPSKNKTWRMAQKLIPEDKYKEFNLGIIDLGALICTPKAPKCELCPFIERCMYKIRHRHGNTKIGKAKITSRPGQSGSINAVLISK